MDNTILQEMCDLLVLNNIVLPDEGVILLQKMFRLSQKWASRINITKNLSFDDFMRENVIDPALACNAFLGIRSFQASAKITDIGCGGGYVGIVWKIIMDNTTLFAGAEGVRLDLIDKDRKKINFCKQLIRELKLLNTTTNLTRIEDFKPLESPGVVVSRATWGMGEFYKKCKTIKWADGCLVALCGPTPQQIDATPSFITANYLIRPLGLARKIHIMS